VVYNYPNAYLSTKVYNTSLLPNILTLVVWFLEKKLKRENPKSCWNELWKKLKHPQKSQFLYTDLCIVWINIIPGITSMSIWCFPFKRTLKNNQSNQLENIQSLTKLKQSVPNYLLVVNKIMIFFGGGGVGDKTGIVSS